MVLRQSVSLHIQKEQNLTAIMTWAIPILRLTCLDSICIIIRTEALFLIQILFQGICSMRIGRLGKVFILCTGRRAQMSSRGKQKPDGTYEYETQVTYWMPFNGGIGFHDASWQPYFGGDR